MPIHETPRFIFPLTAHHVLTVLGIARQDPEAFRSEEMSWVEVNNPWYKNYVGQHFAEMIRRDGIDAGRALMMGQVLANRTVRLCTDGQPGAYDQARANFISNYDLDVIRLRRPDERQSNPRWSSPDVLLPIFGSEDLVDALMQIRHEISRDSASVAIAYFCLEKIPEAAYGQSTSYVDGASSQPPVSEQPDGLPTPEHVQVKPGP